MTNILSSLLKYYYSKGKPYIGALCEAGHTKSFVTFVTVISSDLLCSGEHRQGECDATRAFSKVP